MNHLLLAQYKNKWKNKTNKELIQLQDKLVGKINTVVKSHSVVKSLQEILLLLEKYMQERGIFDKK